MDVAGFYPLSWTDQYLMNKDKLPPLMAWYEQPQRRRRVEAEQYTLHLMCLDDNDPAVKNNIVEKPHLHLDTIVQGFDFAYGAIQKAARNLGCTSIYVRLPFECKTTTLQAQHNLLIQRLKSAKHNVSTTAKDWEKRRPSVDEAVEEQSFSDSSSGDDDDFSDAAEVDGPTAPQPNWGFLPPPSNELYVNVISTYTGESTDHEAYCETCQRVYENIRNNEFKLHELYLFEDEDEDEGFGEEY